MLGIVRFEKQTDGTRRRAQILMSRVVLKN